MVGFISFSAALVALRAAFALPSVTVPPTLDPRILGLLVNDTCKDIAANISKASNVYWPLSLQYSADTAHWASSSSDASACSVEPGSAVDVATILQIVGQDQTPFAVKGGGHSANPGFSSTKGVQISMTRFNDVVYDKASSTATVGAGLVWDDVYEALEPYGVNVVGGRVTGVGVAGFTLGGGYSWLTNQHGLTIDNLVSVEMVLPSGTITTVSEASHPDLFFGIKGGLNNFGIVTKFTFKVYPQGPCWGGLATVTQTNLHALAAATSKFSRENTDPKAAIITAFNALGPTPGAVVIFFYDGPSPPPGVFDDLLAVRTFTKNVGPKSFLEVVKSSPSDATAGQRGVFNTVGVLDYSPEFLDAVINQTTYYGALLSSKSATFLSYDIEPFTPNALSFSAPDSSAYPGSRSKLYLPTNIYYAWTLPASDETMFNAVRESRRVLKEKAISEGQDVADATVYNNYAIFGTPVEEIYGASHLAQLKALKRTYDPNNVMGLAGGFKITA